MTVVWMLLLNLAVGVCIGLTGIAGFLLPMFYTGFFGMGTGEALALSFAAFLVSGALGSVNYYRAGNLELRTAAVLSAGSFAGALAGVRVNLLIPEETIRLLLYLVVLLSGISILLRRDKKETRGEKITGEKITGEKTAKERAAGERTAGEKVAGERTAKEKTAGEKAAEEKAAGGRGGWKKNAGYLLLGVATGAVCAASGAGGPILVMPLLTLIGFPAHAAVGISLFDSVFIALPAAGGYLFSMEAGRELWTLLPALLAVHGAGVLFGSKNAVKINQTLLKRIVAVGSVAVACIKLFF